MKRAELLLLFILLPVLGQTVEPKQVTITVFPGSSAGVTIPHSFLGLGFETGLLTSTNAYPWGSAVFQRMVAQLGPGGLRFGGNSVDRTGWMPGTRTSSTASTVITSSDVDPVLAFARAVEWQVIWGLNLGSGTAAAAADEATYVFQRGSDVISGFEIGNEPDLYANNGLRPPTYSVSDFLAEWRTYADAIQAETPAAVLVGPADAGNINSWTAPFVDQYASRIELLTGHYYPLAPPNVVGANAANSATIPHLLDPGLTNIENSEAAALFAIAQKARLPWRMAETNSCYNFGQPGVSDVFASALWAADYLFVLASNSAAGVNVQAGPTTYTPIAVTGDVIEARPLYYALLLFQAAAQHGIIIPVTVNANGLDLTSYAVQDADGTLRVLIVNKDATQDASIRITPGADFTWAQTISLTGASLDASAGITLGGAAVVTDGSWSPAAMNRLSESGGVFVVDVPAASALLVGFGNGSAAVLNSANGRSQVAPGSLASLYGQNLAFVNRSANSPTLPPTLGGASVTITDSAGVARAAPLMYVSPSLANVLIPDGTAAGTATVSLGGAVARTMVSTVAPGVYTMNGTSVAAATALRFPSNGGSSTAVPVFTCDPGCRATPISLDDESTVYLSLYGTGIRGATSFSVTCTIGGIAAPVQYAGPEGIQDGLDQVNIALPRELKGVGLVGIILTVNGQDSNPVDVDLG